MDDDAVARIKTLDPRRKVDRSQYTDDAMPEHPGLVLTHHVVVRGMQVGSLLGCLVAAPISWIRSGRAEPLVKTVMPRIGATGIVAGGILSGGLLLGLAAKGPVDEKKPPWTDAGVDDRAYRITNNEFVQKMNDFVGAGAAAAIVSGRSHAARGLFGHAAVGMTVGTLTYSFLYHGVPAIGKQWPQARKFLVDSGVDLSILDYPAK